MSLKVTDFYNERAGLSTSYRKDSFDLCECVKCKKLRVMSSAESVSLVPQSNQRKPSTPTYAEKYETYHKPKENNERLPRVKDRIRSRSMDDKLKTKNSSTWRKRTHSGMNKKQNSDFKRVLYSEESTDYEVNAGLDMELSATTTDTVVTDFTTDKSDIETNNRKTIRSESHFEREDNSKKKKSKWPLYRPSTSYKKRNTVQKQSDKMSSRKIETSESNTSKASVKKSNQARRPLKSMQNKENNTNSINIPVMINKGEKTESPEKFHDKIVQTSLDNCPISSQSSNELILRHITNADKSCGNSTEYLPADKPVNERKSAMKKRKNENRSIWSDLHGSSSGKESSQCTLCNAMQQGVRHSSGNFGPSTSWTSSIDGMSLNRSSKLTISERSDNKSLNSLTATGSEDNKYYYRGRSPGYERGCHSVEMTVPGMENKVDKHNLLVGAYNNARKGEHVSVMESNNDNVRRNEITGSKNEENCQVKGQDGFEGYGSMTGFKPHGISDTKNRKMTCMPSNHRPNYEPQKDTHCVTNNTHTDSGVPTNHSCGESGSESDWSHSNADQPINRIRLSKYGLNVIDSLESRCSKSSFESNSPENHKIASEKFSSQGSIVAASDCSQQVVNQDNIKWQNSNQPSQQILINPTNNSSTLEVNPTKTSGAISYACDHPRYHSSYNKCPARISGHDQRHEWPRRSCLCTQNRNWSFLLKGMNRCCANNENCDRNESREDNNHHKSLTQNSSLSVSGDSAKECLNSMPGKEKTSKVGFVQGGQCEVTENPSVSSNHQQNSRISPMPDMHNHCWLKSLRELQMVMENGRFCRAKSMRRVREKEQEKVHESEIDASQHTYDSESSQQVPQETLEVAPQAAYQHRPEIYTYPQASQSGPIPRNEQMSGQQMVNLSQPTQVQTPQTNYVHAIRRTPQMGHIPYVGKPPQPRQMAPIRQESQMDLVPQARQVSQVGQMSSNEHIGDNAAQRPPCHPNENKQKEAKLSVPPEYLGKGLGNLGVLSKQSAMGGVHYGQKSLNGNKLSVFGRPGLLKGENHYLDRDKNSLASSVGFGTSQIGSSFGLSQQGNRQGSISSFRTENNFPKSQLFDPSCASIYLR